LKHRSRRPVITASRRRTPPPNELASEFSKN